MYTYIAHFLVFKTYFRRPERTETWGRETNIDIVNRVKTASIFHTRPENVILFNGAFIFCTSSVFIERWGFLRAWWPLVAVTSGVMALVSRRGYQGVDFSI